MWHRNVACSQYGVQGWRRAKIYPDFIFAAQREGDSPDRILVLETKGDQLAHNPDTEYKRKLLELMSGSFAWDKTAPAGTLEMERDGEAVECALVLMSDWKSALPKFFE